MVCHPLQQFMQMDGTHDREIRSGSNRGARAVRAGLAQAAGAASLQDSIETSNLVKSYQY